MNSTIKVINPSGLFSINQAEQFNREINDSINAGINSILINLKDVNFMDSSGLGLLIVALKTVKAASGKISLCSLRSEVRILLELADVDQFFEIFPDQDSFEQSQK